MLSEYPNNDGWQRIAKHDNLSWDVAHTVCPKGPVKKYLPIARARNQPIT